MTLRTLSRFAGDRKGATAIEYGMLLAFIVVGLIVLMTAIGKSSAAMYENLRAEWEAAEKG